MSCLSCGATDSSFVFEKRTVDAPGVVLDRCRACGLVFRRGWEEGFDDDLYDYYSQRRDWPEARVYKPVNEPRLVELLDELGAHVTGRRLLDVGCGAGQLVFVAKKNGWDARGIDLSTPAIEIARRFGAPCDVLDLFSPELDRERFDVIVMSELVEHVPDPARFLRRASSLLAEGGIVYVTTPNFDSLSRRLVRQRWNVIHRQHVGYFTPESFRHLVSERTDLTVSSLETRNLGSEVVLELRAMLRGGKRSSSTSTKGGPPPDHQSEVRARIERSPVLRLGKRLANVFLRATGAGEALVAVLEKRP